MLYLIKVSLTQHLRVEWAVQVEVKKEDTKLAKPPTLTFDLTSICAAQLLLEFMIDDQPCMLSRWALQAADLDRLAGAALASTGEMHSLLLLLIGLCEHICSVVGRLECFECVQVMTSHACFRAGRCMLLTWTGWQAQPLLPQVKSIQLCSSPLY